MINTTAERKIDGLLEEAENSLRRLNIGTQVAGLTPEELQALQTASGRLKIAVKRD